MDVLGAALRRAAARPEDLVPCPVCGGSAKGRNFPSHLDKHRDVAVGSAWAATGRTWRHPFGVTLSATQDGLRLGRRVHPWAPVAVGGLSRSRPDTVTMTGGDDGFGSVQEHAGTYLSVGRVVVRCATSTEIRRSWSGWTQGRRRKRWRITLAPGDFVALQYVLAEHGLLQPR